MSEQSTEAEYRVRWLRKHDQAEGGYVASTEAAALQMSRVIRESPLFDVAIEWREVTPWTLIHRSK